MPRSILGAQALASARAIRDLTDPDLGPHAMQLLLGDLVEVLRHETGAEPIVHRADPVTTVEDNYDRLRYPRDAVARDERYTRYVGERLLLRTQTSALIPALLDRLAVDPSWRDVLLVCPGLVYRRDSIDRLHTGEPHQVDLWRLARARDEALGPDALSEMISTVVESLLPGRAHRSTPAVHPYTLAGRQIDVEDGDRWVEIGECGLAHPEVLAASGHDPSETSGLAMGLGLDRILMLRKGVPDIRLLRSDDPRVRSQLLDLTPYREVSSQPAIKRDLSVAVPADLTAEDIGDQVRAALGSDAKSVEEVEVLSETPGDALPEAARARLGLVPGQKNVLLRVVLRDLERTLTDAEANELRNRIHAAVHRGTVSSWATTSPARSRRR